MFHFVGRILGRAIYEGVTIQPVLAPFVLSRLLGRPVHLHHLSSIDPELYRSLVFLKNYEGDVADLTLTFTAPSDDGDLGGGGGGGALVPGGDDIAVTAANRHLYVHAVAYWRLSRSIARQTEALVAGFHDVLPSAWLAGFSEPELQALISGASADLDVEDLQTHAAFAGGYFGGHRVVGWLWDEMRAMGGDDRRAVLRFVTACERPPPLGFRSLDPPFTVVRVEGGDDRLPQASTCFNLLKLPAYSSRERLRERLLYAVRAGAGFEMS
jgi:ubiquitin-protein ligase E3 C